MDLMLERRIAPFLFVFCAIILLGACVSSEAVSRKVNTPRNKVGNLSGSVADTDREEKAKQIYFEAEACYSDLRGDVKRRKYRCYWMDCIRKFEEANRCDPSGPWAAAGLYMTGILYDEMYKYSFKEADRQEAKARYEQLIEMYPKSEYSKKADEMLNGKNASRVQPIDSNLDNKPSDAFKESEKGSEPASKDSCTATITGIRYWSNPEYTRVVIDVDGETSFQPNLLKKDPSINQLQQRLYVDLKNCKLGDIDKVIPINDNLLESARAGQFTSDTVRVVVDLKSFESYDVFSLQNPFRIIIDVRGKPSEDITPALPEPKSDTASIAKQLALGVRRIIVDAGHGGKDFGAPGCIKGIQEKDIVLQIAKKLAEKIRNKLNCEVIMTRDTDNYISLEERTAIANTQKADLFISIHANASRDQRASGIETYFLNLTTDDESISVAARENATSKKNISELQTILNDLMQNAKINESSRLATYVQKSVCGNLSKSYSRINDKGVKQAPFYVLLGAQMPAILIETSFISNQTECSRLADPKYQDTLCDGILHGIRQYIKETQPAAHLDLPDQKRHDG
jgi:N-acetylmuramoyl-L-alanine amidase